MSKPKLKRRPPMISPDVIADHYLDKKKAMPKWTHKDEAGYWGYKTAYAVRHALRGYYAKLGNNR